MSNISSASKTPISSSNHKSVLLHKWWLIKVEKESKLGVGGYAYIETLGSRGRRLLGSASFDRRCNRNNENKTENKVFFSAAISKRADNNTLETVDGFTITINGSIHRSRTLSYGFSPEVCDHFISGFPYNWEEYACKFFHIKIEKPLPLSFNDLPVTWAREILMSSTRESETCDFTSTIVKNILEQCSQEDSFTQTVSSTEVELDDEQEVKSFKVIEEDHEIDSFSEGLHEDLGDSKETEAARISTRAGSLPECHLDHKMKQCDSSTLLEVHDRYPLRSKRMKKNN